MDAKPEERVEMKEEEVAETVPTCPICASQMVPAGGTRLVCIACGFGGV